MQEFGEITEIHGDKANILFKRTSACGRCGACGMLANMDNITIQAENTLNAKVGQRPCLFKSTGNVVYRRVNWVLYEYTSFTCGGGRCGGSPQRRGVHGHRLSHLEVHRPEV